MNILYADKGLEVYERGKPIVEVALCYPRIDDERITTIEIGLSDVRAADSIRVIYDFERDGWSVLQASIFEWSTNDPICDADWQEVAFVQAWAREVK